MKEELPFAHDRWMGIGSMKKGKKLGKFLHWVSGWVKRGKYPCVLCHTISQTNDRKQHCTAIANYVFSVRAEDWWMHTLNSIYIFDMHGVLNKCFKNI